jgi:hypothetical protein
MNIAKILLAGTAALAMGSVALAQQSQTGLVTTVDRIHRTVTVQPIPGKPSGIVGANSATTNSGTPNSAPPAQSFKVADGLSLDDVHAGDTATFSASESGDSSTITKFDKP